MTLYLTIQVLSLLPRPFVSIPISRTVHWACSHICIIRWHQLVFGRVNDGVLSFYRLNCPAGNTNFVTRSPIELQAESLQCLKREKQRTNPQRQSTLSTMCFLIYYTSTARAYGSYNSRGIMGHDPHIDYVSSSLRQPSCLTIKSKFHLLPNWGRQKSKNRFFFLFVHV